MLSVQNAGTPYAPIGEIQPDVVSAVDRANEIYDACIATGWHLLEPGPVDA